MPFPEPPLSDGVVALRALRRTDASVIAAWGRDEDIVRWTGVPADYTEEAVLEWAKRVEQARELGRALALVITDAASDHVLGSCDVRRPSLDDPALGEIGYLLSKGARGRGIASRAISLLTAWCLGELRMGRVQALVHPDNPPSARALERVGFRYEGRLRGYRAGDGGREDRLIYAALADDP